MYTKLYTLGVEDVLWVAGYTVGNGSQSKESDHLRLAPSFGYFTRTYVTNLAINLTDYKIAWIDATRSSYQGQFSVGPVKGDRARDDAINIGITVGTRTLTSLDITAANGNYYVKVDCTSEDIVGQHVYAYRIWLGDLPKAGGFSGFSPWIFMKDAWEKRNKIWIPKGMIIPEGI